MANLLVACLAAMLIVAVVGDLRARLIPNWLNAAIALAAIPYWWLLGLPLWPDVAMQIGIAATLFALFAVAFHFGMMGGGDVKLIGAIALWLPLGAVVKLLLVMSIAGGLLTVAMMIRQRVARRQEQPEVPYGVAIAFGGFWVIGEPFLNRFG
jgi:prepilin peptidase CpaA